MNKKIMFGVMAVFLLVAVAIGTSIPAEDPRVGISRGREPCACCEVCAMAQKAMNAVKVKDTDRAMSIIEKALDIHCEDEDLMNALEDAFGALQDIDLHSAGMSLREAIMICQDI